MVTANGAKRHAFVSPTIIFEGIDINSFVDISRSLLSRMVGVRLQLSTDDNHCFVLHAGKDKELTIKITIRDRELIVSEGVDFGLTSNPLSSPLPRILGAIARRSDSVRFDDGTPWHAAPILVQTSDAAHCLAKRISDPGRLRPIVVIGGTDGASWSPGIREIASSVGCGCEMVVYVDDRCTFALSGALGSRRMSVYMGAVRVYVGSPDRTRDLSIMAAEWKRSPKRSLRRVAEHVGVLVPAGSCPKPTKDEAREGRTHVVPFGARRRMNYPRDWRSLAKWIESELAHVVLSPKAKRSLQSPLFADPAVVACALHWLDEVLAPRLRRGLGRTLEGMPVAPGLTVRACGRSAARCRFGGRQITSVWKIRNNASTRDPRRCLRIYFTTMEDGRVLIVDGPNHIRTHLS